MKLKLRGAPYERNRTQTHLQHLLRLERAAWAAAGFTRLGRPLHKAD